MIQRRSFLGLMGATAAAAGTGSLFTPAALAQDKKFTIALVPGLTTDAFYITMHRGAQAAADALGQDLLFQGASEWNVTLQVPVLDAVIARKPDAILIAPTDKVQLVEPLKKANDAGIAVFCEPYRIIIQLADNAGDQDLVRLGVITDARSHLHGDAE